MRCIVTGAAGFIGSSLSDRLVQLGHEVIGIDCFVPYYPRRLKDENLRGLYDSGQFTFYEEDLVDIFDLSGGDKRANAILDGVDVIFHQAAQAGVRASWGTEFGVYVHNNILGTQKLLEACKGRESLKIVYASSSSVYGETKKFPMEETDMPQPVSPYGVSKLAAEHLMCLYKANFGLHTVSLRYFTVYGPRQRPDMAFHRLIKKIILDEEFSLFGTGAQTRDFTYIDDIVQANINAAEMGKPGVVYNIGGGTRISMNDVVGLVEKVTGKTAKVNREERQRGDVTHTGASVERAKADLNFAPKVGLEEGLAREAEFIEQVVLPLSV